ncbi:discoidin domain-containing protein [Candidatus Margulisiibacteriota bacterium]
MKKHVILVFLLIVALSLPALSAQSKLKADTDLARGKKISGTFSYTQFATDGKIKGVSAVSGNISDSPQYLTVDLGMSMYLDRVKIYWVDGALSKDFVVRISPNAKYWEEEARGLDASFGVLDRASNTRAINVSLKRAMVSSRYVQIMIPAGTKVDNKKGNFVRIAEIEIFPAVGQSFSLGDINAYVRTDSSCMIKYKTSIGAASGRVQYGENRENLDKIASNSESGVDNSVAITKLEPQKVYYYQVRTTDYYGRTITSDIKNFSTRGENIALKKKVSGTFVNYPASDKYVKPGNNNEILARVTDGGTNYFTATATSGRVPESDQYVAIDLGKRYDLKSIVSYWRRLAYPESLIVQVSDNNRDWKTLESNVNVTKGVFGRADDGTPMKVVNTKGGSGRYLKILVKKGSPTYHKHSDWDFVQLMEVKAYAD